jgi:hypothetical protein
MSCLPPFISGTRTFKTLAGLERAIARFDGELLRTSASIRPDVTLKDDSDR